MRAFRLLLILLVLLLPAGCGQLPTPAQAPTLSEQVQSPTLPAYPNPAWTAEPTETPAPTFPPLPTETPEPFTPPPTFPPIPTEPTTAPTPVPPFPTPALPAPPAGSPPVELGAIWYPYQHDPNSLPVLQAVLVDQQGQQWGEAERSFPLGEKPGSLLSGGDWQGLAAAPDGRSFIADVRSGEEAESYWIDPASGEVRPISTDPRYEDFLAWGPGKRVFASNFMYSNADIWLIDLDTQEHRAFSFPLTEYGFSNLAGLSLSPDGATLADLCIFGHTVSHPGSDLEVRLQPVTGGERVLLTSLSFPEAASAGRLTWSPDGRTLSFILWTGVYDSDPANDDGQLWLIDGVSGSTRVLAHGLSHYAIAWSPDSRYIAFIRDRSPDTTVAPLNLGLFDLATSTESQLTHLTGRYVYDMAWSPDGSNLALSIVVGDPGQYSDEGYSEVSVASLDGARQYPIAGPAARHAPVLWLPASKGGQ